MTTPVAAVSDYAHAIVRLTGPCSLSSPCPGESCTEHGKMPTAETVIGFTPYTAQAICGTCGTRFHAAGSDPRGALYEVADVHDAECADLMAAARLLRGAA